MKKDTEKICGFNQNAITLIALVITIIILLILSGVVINLTLGERGILNMAKQAGEEYKRTAAQEKITLALVDYEARTNTTNMTEEQKKTTLLDTLNNLGTTTEEEDHYKVIVDGYEFWVDKDTLEVESKGGNQTKPEEPVNPPAGDIEVAGITVNPTTITATLGDSEKKTINVTFDPTNATNKTVTWTTSNNKVATVVNGEVTIVGAGTCNITVTTNNGKTATCAITVEKNKEITYSWEELEKIAEAISNTTSYNKDTDSISVTVEGETKTLTVGDWKNIDGKKVRILGFNHDDLGTGVTYSGRTTATSKAGITFGYDEPLMEEKMHSERSISGGWVAKDLYATLNNTSTGKYKELQSAGIPIKKVKKIYTTDVGPEAVSTSEDYLWLLSYSELYGSEAGSAGSALISYREVEGTKYRYFVGSMLPGCYMSGWGPGYQRRGDEWLAAWLRSSAYVPLNDIHDFQTVIRGNQNSRSANIAAIVAPGFAI